MVLAQCETTSGHHASPDTYCGSLFPPDQQTIFETRATCLDDIPDGTVLYDGLCVFCSLWFRFVAARDPQVQFRFAHIQSREGRWLAVRLAIDANSPSTNAVILKGRAYFRSDAGLQILSRLPGRSWTRMLLAVPHALRAWIDDRIARNRYRVFGRTQVCTRQDASLMRHILSEFAPSEQATGRLQTPAGFCGAGPEHDPCLPWCA